MALSEHTARQSSADLFLDTVPFNAWATARSALWAGVPVLTLIGQAFSSRRAASLLYAVGLPEQLCPSSSAKIFTSSTR